MNWMARAVQQPDSIGEVAVVLRGGRGTGKSLFARMFGALFGAHFLQVSDPKHLVGSFNAHLRDTIVLFADEAFYAGDKKHESILKTLVTESTFIVEGKGIDAETARNYTHLIMASNDAWVVPAGQDERRFFVLDVGARRAQDTVYFKAVTEQMQHGGYEALLHLLKSRDISSFEVRTVPQTRALREQKQLSQEPHEAVFLEMLRTGVTPDPDPLKNAPNWVSVEGIVDAIAERRELPKNRRSLQTQVGLYLQKFVELDRNGNPVSVRVKRTCAISGGRLVGDMPEDYSGPLTEVRRTMYRLRPLHDLRVEQSHLIESWPAYPGKWTLDPEPPDDEKGAYELAMAGPRAA
jgi:MoxR-like ATPase